MSFDFKEIVTATMVLFAIIDIFGMLPIIITTRNRLGYIASDKVTFLGFILMIVFLFSGERLLDWIGISVASFAVAGSIVLFIIALEMILGIQLHKHDQQDQKQSAFVPLIFPLMIGPGTLTSLLSLKAEFQTINIVIAIVVNSILVFLVLHFSKKLERIIGPATVNIIQRIFGIILMAIAIKLFAGNITHVI